MHFFRVNHSHKIHLASYLMMIHPRFINSDDEKDELHVILTNPGAKQLLDKLYNRKKPFY